MNDNKCLTYTLYEYGKLQSLPKENSYIREFKNFLDEVWINYKDTVKLWHEDLSEDNFDTDIRKHQQFLFFDDRDNFKSKNYVGYIKFKDSEFNLYPKICKDKNGKQAADILLKWLMYSDMYNFPHYKTGLASFDCDDLFECLIYLYAKYTYELFSTTLFQHYEEIQEETNFLKGKLNFTEYAKNIATGKSHKFYCTYDSFEFNNKFNQIVKYVTKRLLSISKKNQELLNKILFLLDEVDDVLCTYEDCKKVYINRFMEDFVTVLDYCKLFLQNCITFNQSGIFETFAFLLRTEILFEDYISNLAKEVLTEYQVKIQRTCSLDNEKQYHIRPDILIYENSKKENLIKIVDVKYKDVKSRDISYSDIYQCMAYAKKLKCNDVTLIYPKTSNEEFQNNNKSIKIDDIEIKLRFIDCCSNEDSIGIRELLGLD